MWPMGTLRPKVGTANVRSWRKLTWGRSGAVPGLTPNGHERSVYAVLHNGVPDVVG